MTVSQVKIIYSVPRNSKPYGINGYIAASLFIPYGWLQGCYVPGVDLKIYHDMLHS